MSYMTSMTSYFPYTYRHDETTSVINRMRYEAMQDCQLSHFRSVGLT